MKTIDLARMSFFFFLLKKVEQSKQGDFCLDCLKIVINTCKHDLGT